MRPAVKSLDVVVLTNDLPEYTLWRGQVGTVVEVLRRGEALEVDFADRQGHTYESLGLTPDPFIVLRYDPSDPQSTSELVLA